MSDAILAIAILGVLFLTLFVAAGFIVGGRK